MKYDDSEYHFLNFETDLDNHAANTHIGMYLAWAALAGLTRDDPADTGWTAAVAQVRARRTTGADLLSDQCDGKLTPTEFNDEGNAFTAGYYDAQFHRDYARVFDSQIPRTGHDADDLCSVPDTWANFDLIRPVLDARLATWRAGRQPPGPSLAGSTDIAALRRRAEAGDRDAWYDLAVEYITGIHVPKDHAQAADAFEKAAQAGLPAAAFNLGVCYQNGDGRPHDAKQRLRWFAQAAEGGHGPAAYFLAMAYRQGDALEQDFVASNALMLIAQQRGVDEARREGIMAGSLSESTALAAQLSQPGQLVAVLSARRRKLKAGQVDSGVERWKRGPAGAPRTDVLASRGVPRDQPGRRGSFGPAHLAMLIGASSFVLLMLLGLRGPRFVTLSWTLSAIGAAGAWFALPALGVRGVLRGLVTLLAVLPVMGSFIDIWLLLRWYGRR